MSIKPRTSLGAFEITGLISGDLREIDLFLNVPRRLLAYSHAGLNMDLSSNQKWESPSSSIR